MENQESLVNIEAITADDINMNPISNTQSRDIYKVQPRCNKALKLIVLNILKYLSGDILHETLLCSCEKADNNNPLLPFQYSIFDYDDRKKSSISESERPSLVNLKNLEYNILKNLDDETVRDIDFSELRSYSEYQADALHIISNLLLSDPRRTFQSSGISPLFKTMGKTFILSSPPIWMGGTKSITTQQFKKTDDMKTVNDKIITNNFEIQNSNIMQNKRTMKSASTKKSSSKKQKTLTNDGNHLL
ncbi:hypothetical protein C1645_817937 [Glomus cerebriforme]|uniref:Uncharacterized protein n=1 Tax=Glomus cerebriforme TaxID=658196 RepID=A0A397TAS1_9GLOM|nr:hypothetical protein C1645_817937 [Glomus cerebriforme]